MSASTSSPTTIHLASSSPPAGQFPPLQFTIEDETEREEVVKRLRRICGDERTHGIDIQRQLIPIPSSDSQLEVSVWDFGGQHEYYNNHHYFLSARSVFLVVWKATEGVDDQLGVSGLEFWLNSLKAHLPPPPAGNGKPFYSMIVVGTHIDGLVGHQQTYGLRKTKVQEVFSKKCGMENLPFEYIEVSSRSGENMSLLHERITSCALGHAYMGELIPKSYLRVEDEIMKMREEKKKQVKEVKELPIVDLRTEFVSRLGEMQEDEVMRAIGLLHLWGSCIHFSEEKSSGLSTYLVLDPSFLSQVIFSRFFDNDRKQVDVTPDQAFCRRWTEVSKRADFFVSLFKVHHVSETFRERGRDSRSPSKEEVCIRLCLQFRSQDDLMEILECKPVSFAPGAALFGSEITHLDLSNLNLTTIPKCLGELFCSLSDCHVASNTFSFIPVYFSSLQHLILDKTLFPSL